MLFWKVSFYSSEKKKKVDKLFVLDWSSDVAISPRTFLHRPMKVNYRTKGEQCVYIVKGGALTNV
jgi:hypothetical protein